MVAIQPRQIYMSWNFFLFSPFHPPPPPPPPFFFFFFFFFRSMLGFLMKVVQIDSFSSIKMPNIWRGVLKSFLGRRSWCSVSANIREHHTYCYVQLCLCSVDLSVDWWNPAITCANRVCAWCVARGQCIPLGKSEGTVKMCTLRTRTYSYIFSSFAMNSRFIRFWLTITNSNWI